jgi:hypothetical protein
MLAQKHFRDFKRHMPMMWYIRVSPAASNMLVPQILCILKSEVLTGVVIKLCNPLKIDQSFGGTCRLHLKGRRISQTRNQHEAGKKQGSLSTCLFLFFEQEDGSDMFFRNVGYF